MNLLRLVSFDQGTMLHSIDYVIRSVSCLGVRLMKVSLSRPHAELRSCVKVEVAVLGSLS